MKTIKKTFAFLLFGVFTLTACKKDADTFQPQVVNQSDNFSFQATNVNNGTKAFEYTWTNTGTKANITISTQGQATQMDIKVYDALGAEVYSDSLDNIGSFTTNSGTTGQWRIVIVFKSFNGSVNLTVKKGI